MNDDPKALFEGAVQRLDAGAAGRLRQARRAALAGAAPARTAGARWMPAIAAMAMLVLGLAWWLPQRGAAPAPAATTAPAVAAAATENDEDAVLAEDGEDADLYAWLAEAPVAADPNDPEQRL